MINSGKMQEILSMIDIYCCTPYEFTLKRLSDIEFFTIFIYRLMWIDEGGNMEFTIKKKTPFRPF